MNAYDFRRGWKRKKKLPRSANFIPSRTIDRYYLMGTAKGNVTSLPQAWDEWGQTCPMHLFRQKPLAETWIANSHAHQAIGIQSCWPLEKGIWHRKNLRLKSEEKNLQKTSRLFRHTSVCRKPHDNRSLMLFLPRKLDIPRWLHKMRWLGHRVLENWVLRASAWGSRRWLKKAMIFSTDHKSARGSQIFTQYLPKHRPVHVPPFLKIWLIRLIARR